MLSYDFHWGPVVKALPELLWATLRTFEIASQSMVLAVILGLLLSLAATSRFAVLRLIRTVWVELARNTPALLQIYMVYFGLGSFGLRIDSYAALVIGITFNCAGYLSETFRGGLRSIPAAQINAARSLGMTSRTVFLSIVLPQLFRVVYFPLTNQFIWAILMSSLGVIVGMTSDLMGVTQQLSVVSFRTFEYFAAAAVLYYLLVKITLMAARLFASRLFRY